MAKRGTAKASIGKDNRYVFKSHIYEVSNGQTRKSLTLPIKWYYL